MGTHCHAGFTKRIVQLISRYWMDAQTEILKGWQTFRGTYIELTKEYFQKTGDTFMYFEHQLIQENFQKIWQVSQLRYSIRLFFCPKVGAELSLKPIFFIFPYLTFSTYGISLS